jgi:hypothetical protein
MFLSLNPWKSNFVKLPDVASKRSVLPIFVKVNESYVKDPNEEIDYFSSLRMRNRKGTFSVKEKNVVDIRVYSDLRYELDYDFLISLGRVPTPSDIFSLRPNTDLSNKHVLERFTSENAFENFIENYKRELFLEYSPMEYDTFVDRSEGIINFYISGKNEIMKRDVLVARLYVFVL